MRGKIFVEAIAQYENIGDSVLRRRYLNVLRRFGDLHVLVGGHPGYISGLELDPADVCYERRRQWAGALWGCMLTGQRICIATNSGETTIFLLRPQKTWWLLFLNKLFGGRNILCGVGLRQLDPPRMTYTQKVMANCYLSAYHYISWRDADSRQWMGGRGHVHPDWAFAEGQSDDQLLKPDFSRRHMAISLRGDRPFPGAEWLMALKTIAAAKGLGLIAIAQVGRDEKYARRIADLLNCRHVAWTDPGLMNRKRESVVRGIYRESAMVVSDRLHALILGLTEGALPLGFATESAEKSERALATIGIHGVCYNTAHASTDGFIRSVNSLFEKRANFPAKVPGARRQLEALELDLQDLIR